MDLFFQIRLRISQKLTFSYHSFISKVRSVSVFENKNKKSSFGKINRFFLKAPQRLYFSMLCRLIFRGALNDSANNRKSDVLSLAFRQLKWKSFHKKSICLHFLRTHLQFCQIRRKGEAATRRFEHQQALRKQKGLLLVFMASQFNKMKVVFVTLVNMSRRIKRKSIK